MEERIIGKYEKPGSLPAALVVLVVEVVFEVVEVVVVIDKLNKDAVVLDEDVAVVLLATGKSSGHSGPTYSPSVNEYPAGPSVDVPIWRNDPVGTVDRLSNLTKSFEL